MTASYADPVDVQRRDGSPTAFCWRGRVYLVRGVLAHWLETGPWWQSASLRALLPTATRPRETSTHSSATPAAAGRAAPSSAPAAGEEQTGEREFWQVEAAAGRHATPGVYELCADWSAGAPGVWSVTTIDNQDRSAANPQAQDTRQSGGAVGREVAGDGNVGRAALGEQGRPVARGSP